VKGDYGLRKEQTTNGGYRWVPDTEAEGYWLDNLLDVPACRKFLRETLGEVTVEPVGGAKTVPVEHRVRLVA
jgi:hypothetical protein